MATRKLPRPRLSHKSTLAQRLAYYSQPQPNGCRLWIAARNPKGYGHLKWEGVVWQAHRLSWTHTNGPIPDGMEVLHRCDTPPCIEPACLFLGTNYDNVRDRVGKQRSVRLAGERNGRAILTAADVLAIRADSRGPSAIAPEYGVSAVLISRIKHRKAWTHI